MKAALIALALASCHHRALTVADYCTNTCKEEVACDSIPEDPSPHPGAAICAKQCLENAGSATGKEPVPAWYRICVRDCYSNPCWYINQCITSRCASLENR